MKMLEKPAQFEPASDAYFIRPAVRRELPEIADLVGEAIGAYRGEAPSEPLRRYIERSRDFSKRWDRGEVLVATQYGRIVGTATFFPDASEAGFPSNWASFGTLAVHPQLQRRGIASLLVRRCVAFAVAVAPTVGIHTADFMRGAQALYAGMGFVRVPKYDMRASEVSDLPPGVGDVHIMAYRLDLETAFSS
jgi:predicted N-acetyltransferase YhbS